VDRPIFIDSDLRVFSVRNSTNPKHFAAIPNSRYYTALCYIKALEERLGLDKPSAEVAPVAIQQKQDPAGALNPKLPAGIPKKR
jgi:hypothetical protein